MKKHVFYLLLVALLAGFVSCSNEDDAPRTDCSNLNLQVKENTSIVIEPETTAPSAKYTWYVNGKCVSSDTKLKFTGEKVGVQTVLLKTTYLGRESTTNYIVNVLPYNINYVTLDVSSYNLVQNGTATTGGYYWNKTYSDTKFQSQIFTFSHTGGDVSGYAYWDGFTISNTTDKANYGAPGSSDGWIAHQWGCMASGETPKNFLIGYWGYYMKDYQATGSTFSEAQYSNWIKIENGTSRYNAISVKIANHPWPFYGILHGDGFARAFKVGDYFKLLIYGVDANNNIKSKPVEYYLSDCRTSVIEPYSGWKKVTLSPLGEVKYLLFKMESTDNSGQYGPNTAVYFCLDELVVDKI